MAELDTFEFNTLTMDKIANGIEEKSIDAIIDETTLWDADSGDMLKAFDDILCADTLKIVNNEKESIDGNVLKEKEKFENFTDLLMELEEDGEDLDPIIIGSNVDNLSSPFLENGCLDPIVLGTDEHKMYFPFNTPINVPSRFENSIITPMNVPSRLEKSMYQNFPANMKNFNEPEFIAVRDVKYQSNKPQLISPLNRIYPRRVSQSSDIPSSIPLHYRNTLNAYSHANSSIPAPYGGTLQQQRPFNVIPNIVPSSAVMKEKKKKPVQSKKNVQYRDLSKMTDEEAARNCKYANMRGRSQEPFPVKLHSIIERSEQGEFSTIISWAPHGRAFKIHNEVLFVEKVLPLYFFQSKMSSFTRQLRMYGFHKMKNKYNVDKGAYLHELFLRGRPGLAYGLVRLNSPCAASRQYEPNLYEFPPMPSSNPCDQSESSPSNDETAKKNSINLRTIRYVSFSSAENPTTSNVSQTAFDVNDEDRKETEQSIVPVLPMLEKKVSPALSELPPHQPETIISL